MHTWRSALLALACTLAAASCSARLSGPYETKAAWDERQDSLELSYLDFDLHDVEPSESHGTLFRGDGLVLRAEGGDLFALLGLDSLTDSYDLYPPHDVVSELDSGTLVIAGPADEQRARRHGASELFAQSNIVVTLIGRTGDVRTVPGPPRIRLQYPWLGLILERQAAGRLLAILQAPALDLSGPRPLSSPPRLRTPDPELHDRFYSFDGSTWSELPSPAPPGTMLVSSCMDTTGVLWVAGTANSADESGTIGARRGFVARYEAGAWREDTPPAPREPHLAWSLGRIVCGADGLWLAGAGIDTPERVRSWLRDDLPVLYRRRGERWEQVSLPPIAPNADGSIPERYGIGPLAADTDGRVWFGYGRSDSDHVTDPLHRYDGEKWETFALPRIGNLEWYDVLDLDFDSHGEGWAVANLRGSAVHPESQGFLLRFHGDAWRLQSFKIPFWRKRWLSLLG